jgi:ABC-type branched-subunit amino acid transport system substrate-binding protein
MRARSSKRSLALLALVFVLLATGCGLPRSAQQDYDPRGQDKATVRRQAEQAWREKRYRESETLYLRLVDMPGASYDERAQAWERYALSALENGHAQQALDAMPKWTAVAPQAPQTKLWQDTYLRAVKGISDTGVRDALLNSISQDKARPWRMRAGAIICLATLNLAKGDVHGPLGSLSGVRNQASTQGRQALADIEEQLFRELQSVSAENLDAFAMIIPETQRNVFPNTVIQLEKARRLLNAKSTSQAQAILNGLKPLIANKELLAALLGTKDVAPSSLSVALLLPLTGSYGEIGSKIVRGAGAAQAELSQGGQPIDVQIVNSETPDWQTNLRNLPPSVGVVGGPLHVNAFKELSGARLTDGRAFFAFLTGLGEAAEGRQAWRFFASPQDQARILVETALRQGVQSASILYPQENYGQLMTQLIEKEAAGRLSIVAKIAYPINDNKSWAELAGRAAKGVSAIFMPGDWAHAEALAPHIINSGGQNALLLGTAIWAQTIARKKYVELPTFSRAVFPGAWNPASMSAAAQRLKSKMAAEGLSEPDYWVALGYDFVRFAAQLGPLPANWTPAVVNERLRQAQSAMDWAAAPMVWDAQGQGHAQLFMFKPTENGYTLLDGATGAATAPATGAASGPAYGLSPSPAAQSGGGMPPQRVTPED